MRQKRVKTGLRGVVRRFVHRPGALQARAARRRHDTPRQNDFRTYACNRVCYMQQHSLTAVS